MIGTRADTIDPYAQGEMAGRVEIAGVAEARLPIATTIVLAVLGGAFLALGSSLATATIAATALGYSISRLLGLEPWHHRGGGEGREPFRP
jgi:formate/nitrite transporter FocA (FNT family)